MRKLLAIAAVLSLGVGLALPVVLSWENYACLCVGVLVGNIGQVAAHRRFGQTKGDNHGHSNLTAFDAGR